MRLTGGRSCWRERGHSYRSICSYMKLPPPACPGTTCITELTPGISQIDALGNTWADVAAVTTRKTDHELVHGHFQKAQTWHQDQFLQSRHNIFKYLAALDLDHVLMHQINTDTNSQSAHHDSTQDWSQFFQKRLHYTVPHPPVACSPDIHPKVIAACLWGNQYAALVQQFCVSLYNVA